MNPQASQPRPINISTTRSLLSAKPAQFTESVIREMTRLALEHGAVNLSQGFPDFASPAELKRAAKDAIDADMNQYSITWGTKSFRKAIAEKFERTQGVRVDPEREVTVCCGSTEAMIASMLALINAGDEVVVFEPFYENYGPDIILSDAVPRYVKLRAPDWSFDPAELAAAFGPKTKAIVINTPHNPTGKVFTRAELETIRDLCVRWNAFAITDEIYEHILYDGAKHLALAAVEGMRDRTITINSLSKTYSVTGWRVGWAIAEAKVCTELRKVHDFLTVNAATPLQEAGVHALQLPASYYEKLAGAYMARRDRLMGILTDAGFRCLSPRGAYYIMADISAFGFTDDVAFARHLVTDIGVAAVPGSSFFRNGADGRSYLRFTFCKKEETFQRAAERLTKLQRAVTR
jgi:aspartate/methionine/tyrosine aminotransferase